MSATIILTATAGNIAGERFLFRGPDRLFVGRSEICGLRLPDDEFHWDVSRLHCLLDVNPPGVAVRDVGSRNGTFVNGEEIGRRPARLGPRQVARGPAPLHRLQGDDELRVGRTVFRVEVRTAAAASAEATEVPEAEAARAG